MDSWDSLPVPFMTEIHSGINCAIQSPALEMLPELPSSVFDSVIAGNEKLVASFHDDHLHLSLPSWNSV